MSNNFDKQVLLQVKQGFEPNTFKCHFLGWNPSLWAQNQSFEAYKESVTSGVTSVQDELKQYDDTRKLSYEELKGTPSGIDLTKKEVWRPASLLSLAESLCYNCSKLLTQMYLTEEEFQKVFDITVHEFKGLPNWKKNDMKRKVGLF